MKTKRLIKAIEKAGLKVEVVKGNIHYIQGKNHHGEFVNQDGTAVCVNTCPNGDKSDSMTDYFPQRFHKTIKTFIERLTE